MKKLKQVDEQLPFTFVFEEKQKKSYCSSALYVYNVLKWRPCVTGAKSFDIATESFETLNPIKGFMRRLLNAVQVSSCIDELQVLSKEVQSQIYDIVHEMRKLLG